MYVDIGQEEPLVVKAEAAVPIRHGERAQDRDTGDSSVLCLRTIGGSICKRTRGISLTGNKAVIACLADYFSPEADELGSR